MGGLLQAKGVGWCLGENPRMSQKAKIDSRGVVGVGLGLAG